jgi:hypothetical protein
MPLNSIPSHHLQTAPRQTRAILRRGRGAVVLHRAYKWSSILQATKPRILFFCGKFTARLTTKNCSSAGLLTAQSSFVMQSALPWAIETLLHLRRSVPSPLLCPMPLFHRSIGGKSAQASALAPLCSVCGLQRLRCTRHIFSALFGSISVRDCTAASSDNLLRSLHGTGPAASSQGTNEGLGCCSATSETVSLGRHCKGSISVSVQQKLCTERGLQYDRLQVVAVGHASSWLLNEAKTF